MHLWHEMLYKRLNQRNGIFRL
ncbi:hypothetical protein CY0110_18492 [Crocosphaera chwakensis CCY0110]|uniref:Uncharacterized protein n=1 Tax=Crocosphaera chwakensis CCY0110 TaxID=391612 RepID=A3IJ30_9CHRO|nr:hypothetical protein CY0110_18492 [Crocosphaera chwakensis CCY0110]